MFYSEQLMKAEEKGSGKVAWSVYGAYIKAAGGPLIFIINIFLFVSTVGSVAFSNWWLSYWIRQGSGVSFELFLPHGKKNYASFYCIFVSQKKNTYCASLTCDRRLTINLNVRD